MRVLVAEDHVVLAGRIAEGLRDAGLAVDVAHDGAAALTTPVSPHTTSSCWTGTCQWCTATGSADSSPGAAPGS